jgi:asparagine synthase (glutamine-hydrolysing)
MCGICGVVLRAPGRVEPALVRGMADTMVHRGPDDDGLFVEGRVGLGFRRLAIIDVAGGHQPMASDDGALVLVYNGETYNYAGLRTELESRGHVFRTKSDTEVVLRAYEAWGARCVDRLQGMFALALWDARRQVVLLARDRLGVKPLYYTWAGGALVFASEIKALLAYPGVDRAMDEALIDLYAPLGFVPGPRTMFRSIAKLMPGETLEVGARTRATRYWDVPIGAAAPAEEPAARYREALGQSVEQHLVSDVPLGIFLSGGVDSSAVTALASRALDGPVRTFALGYASQHAEDECAYARLVAERLGTDHHEFRLEATDFRDFLPKLVWHLDEPLADLACIPLYFVSRLARRFVTVVLSGEGADETLGGYGIYRRMLLIERLRRWGGGALARMLPHGLLPRGSPVTRLAAGLRLPLGRRYHGVATFLDPSVDAWLRHVPSAPSAVADALAPYYAATAGQSPLARMLYLDLKVWLPDNLLVKADRMTMANSQELRVPFLDHHLVEHAAVLPDAAKVGGGAGKRVLRQAMDGLLPAPVLRRPKQGFPVPLAAWFRGPLAELVRDTLLAPNAMIRTHVRTDRLQAAIDDHVGGRADWSRVLWALLVLETWHDTFVQG